VARRGGEPIFPNAGDLLWARDARATFPVPEREDPTTLTSNRRLGIQVAEMASVVRARHGVIVWANTKRWYVDPLPDLERRLSLRVLDREPDGAILTLPG